MRIGYWVITLALVLVLVGTGIMDVLHNPQMAAGISSLGYPLYFLTIDGTAKILAAAAILAPSVAASERLLSTLREWAYAGLTFLTLGATWSHLANGQSPAIAVVVLLLALGSRSLRRRAYLTSAHVGAPASTAR